MNNVWLKNLARATNQRLVMPFYHAVSDIPPLHLNHLYRIRSQKQFAADLDALLKIYKPISLDTLIRFTKGEAHLPKFACFISFDDGLREFGELAWPILQQKGIPVTLFINPGFVDNKAMFYRLKASLLIEAFQSEKTIDFKSINESLQLEIQNLAGLIQFVQNVSYENQSVLDQLADLIAYDFELYQQTVKPYLELEELKQLQQSGVAIGTHSMDHPLFHKLSQEQQFQQVNDSIGWIKQYLHSEYSAFSFPFTDYGIPAGFFKQLREDNPGVQATFGTAGLKKEKIPTHFQRIPIENNAWTMEQILAYQYFYFIMKAPFFKNTIQR